MRSLAPLLLLAVGCVEPELSGAFNQVVVWIENDPAGAARHFIERADAAEFSLKVALPAGQDTELTDSLLAAWDRGVDVELVTDIDRVADAGIATLLAAGLPVTLADDGITYFDFNINADVAWTSEQTIMSHAWLIVDDVEMVAATATGDLASGSRIVLTARGEELIEDLTTEHAQVYGGTDAVATTAFDGVAKSIADFRWSYPTQGDFVLEMWFGPQERTTKRVIDAVYGAKSSVWVLTDDFANEGLAHALQEKAAWGFDVQVVVGPSFASSAPELSNALRTDTPDVPKFQVNVVERVPTLVLVDYNPSVDQRYHRPHAMVLTHPLYAAARLHRGREVLNDQLIDGTLFTIDTWGPPTETMMALLTLFDAHKNAGVPL